MTDIVVAGILIIAVAAAVKSIIKARKNGGTCSGCASAGTCPGAKSGGCAAGSGCRDDIER